MTANTDKEKLEELADVCNELCVALETGLINVDRSKFNFVQKFCHNFGWSPGRASHRAGVPCQGQVRSRRQIGKSFLSEVDNKGIS